MVCFQAFYFAARLIVLKVESLKLDTGTAVLYRIKDFLLTCSEKFPSAGLSFQVTVSVWDRGVCLNPTGSFFDHDEIMAGNAPPPMKLSRKASEKVQVRVGRTTPFSDDYMGAVRTLSYA